jgi:hypothetical protein
MSWSIECASPDSAEPTRKIRMGRHEQPLPPVHVAELPVKRRGDGRGEHVRGDHPGQVSDPAECADDARQRGADDQLVEHGQHDREQQAGQDDQDLAPGPRRRPRALLGLCRCHYRPSLLARRPLRPADASRL